MKAAINGLGRIGRAALKIILERNDMELVGVNDLVSTENLAYLLKYDTVYGRYGRTVEHSEKALIIDGKEYPVTSEKDPSSLSWGEKNVDVVFECTGVFTKTDQLKKHIDAGAKKVLLSAPAKSDDIPTVVYGTNDADGSEQIISCASCTTNCITPVVEIVGRTIGIKKAILNTIHAYTSTQSIVDSPASKMRRGRAGAANLVPTSTGAAVATTKALPRYRGMFHGIAIRCPVPVGSVADIVIVTEKKTSAEELLDIFEKESRGDRYKGVVELSRDPLVSSDIIKNPHASIIDGEMIQVIDGDLVRVMSWYDNEWGYANQMIRQAAK